jgi:hypothetical protein
MEALGSAVVMVVVTVLGAISLYTIGLHLYTILMVLTGKEPEFTRDARINNLFIQAKARMTRLHKVRHSITSSVRG